MTSSTFSPNPLGYEGIDFYQNPPFINANRPPSTHDQLNPGSIWQDNSVNPPNQYITSGAGTWVVLSSGAGFVGTLTGNTGGAISPSSGNINVVGTGSISVAGSGSTLTISSSGGGSGLTWNNNATSGTTTTNNGYIITAGAQSFSLPAASAVGDQLAFMLNGGTSWTITQAAGQQIRVNNNQSTFGAGGSVATSAQGQTILLICTGANTTWQALSFTGGLSVV